MKAQKISLSDWSNQALSSKEMSSIEGGFGFPHNIFATRKRFRRHGGAGGTYFEGETPEGEEGFPLEEVI